MAYVKMGVRGEWDLYIMSKMNEVRVVKTPSWQRVVVRGRSMVNEKMGRLYGREYYKAAKVNVKMEVTVNAEHRKRSRMKARDKSQQK